MSIPLYFAVNWKESVNNSQTRLAQSGFGLKKDGSARLPERWIPNALRMIDDAVLPESAVSAAAIERLASVCKNGCFFDFERPVCQTHLSLIIGLRSRLPPKKLFALPERFLSFAPDALPVVTCPKPCNSWKEFARQVQKRHRNGWMLEIVPWSYTVPTKHSFSEKSDVLTAAMCSYQRKNTVLRYYDTRKSIEEKLTLAEEYGCRAAIGIWSELIAL